MNNVYLNGEDCKDIIYGENYGDFIVGDIGEIVDPYIADEEICSQVVSDALAIAYVPLRDSMDINFRRFGYPMIPEIFGLLDTSSVEDIGELRLRRQPFVDLHGANVLIGMIDTGIDYLHPVFRNDDGTTRIVSIWDQTLRDGTPPFGFFHGGYFNQKDINAALVSENPLEMVPTVDDVGHGTFLAGIAAGNEMKDQKFTGVAPKAGIIMVKLKEAKNNLKEYFAIEKTTLAYSETDIMLAVRFLKEEAQRKKRPLVILFGVGSNKGNHDGQLPLCKLLSQYCSNEGMVIIAAAGNEGNRGSHYQNTHLKRGENEQVEIRVAEGEYGMAIELWSEAPNLLSIGIISPLGEEISKVPIQDKAQQRFRFPFEDTRIMSEYVLVEELTGDLLILIRLLKPTPGIWKIRVYNESMKTVSYNMWLPMAQMIKEETRFLKPDPDITLCEPANSKDVLVVTAFNHYDNSLFLHASRGYTLSLQKKPEMAAPGVNVYGPLPRGRYGRTTGSSVAAAHAAGCAALLLEWGVVKGNSPYMQTIGATNYLIRGARRRNMVYPNREWGYGELDIFGVFEKIYI